MWHRCHTEDQAGVTAAKPRGIGKKTGVSALVTAIGKRDSRQKSSQVNLLSACGALHALMTVSRRLIAVLATGL